MRRLFTNPKVRSVAKTLRSNGVLSNVGSGASMVRNASRQKIASKSGAEWSRARLASPARAGSAILTNPKVRSVAKTLRSNGVLSNVGSGASMVRNASRHKIASKSGAERSARARVAGEQRSVLEQHARPAINHREARHCSAALLAQLLHEGTHDVGYGGFDLGCEIDHEIFRLVVLSLYANARDICGVAG